MMSRSYRNCVFAVLLAGGATSAYAEMSAEELAKIAQNPVGNLISLPFQNNTNLNFGPEKGTQNILNIQPVIPISISDDWNIITRTILPVIWQPALGPDDGASAASAICNSRPSCHRPSRASGSGVPARSCRRRHKAMRNSAMTTGAWDPRSSCCTSTRAVRGSMACWSTTCGRSPATSRAARTATGLIQPFVNYNFEGGALPHERTDCDGQLESRGQPAVDRAHRRRRRQDLPFGKLPVNTQISAYYNVVKPDFGANWQIRAQIQLMFPK